MDAVLLGIAASADKRSKQNATAIEALKGGWRYKGAVEDYAHLPSSGNKIGDVWTTLDDGNEYAWGAVDGVNQWIQIGGVVNPLTDAEVINALGAYPIDLTITNGTYTGSPYVLGTQTIAITPSTGYEAPASITVNGTTGTSGSTGVTWSYSNGVITLSNATDVVEISATCPAQPTYSHFTIANLPSDPDYPYMALKVSGCHTTSDYVTTFKYNGSEYSTNDKVLWIPLENGEFTKRFLCDYVWNGLYAGNTPGSFIFIKSPTPITEGFGAGSESGMARMSGAATLYLKKQDGTTVGYNQRSGQLISFANTYYAQLNETISNMYYDLSVTF